MLQYVGGTEFSHITTMNLRLQRGNLRSNSRYFNMISLLLQILIEFLPSVLIL